MAEHVGDNLSPEHILPSMDDWEVFPREAAAVGIKAQELGLARKQLTYDELYQNAKQIISRSRDMTRRLMEEHFIAEAPTE
jgi:malate dehydrogenase (oxaloacetate-decarboxylating)